MSTNNSKVDQPSGKVDRRQMNRLLAASGLGLISFGAVTGRANAADDIMVVDWSNYHTPEMLVDYAKKYGRIPPLTVMTSNDEALQKILSRAVKVDASHPDTVDLPRWRLANVIRPIDESKLPNWPDVFDEIKAVPNVYADGKLWIVPASFGNVSVIYRTDLVAPEDSQNPTWKILWDERYAGRVALNDQAAYTMGVAGLLSGAKNIWNMSDQEMAAAGELLRAQRKVNRFNWSDITTMEQAMASGEIVAAMGWNTSVASLQKAGVPVAMMKPKEGIFTWLDGIVWVNTGEGPEQRVYDLMDAWIGVDAGKYLINNLAYGHTNRKTYEAVEKERLAAIGLEDPISVLKRGLFGAPEEKAREKGAALWEEIKSGF